MPIMRSRMLAYPPSQLLFALVTQRKEGVRVAWRDQTMDPKETTVSVAPIQFIFAYNNSDNKENKPQKAGYKPIFWIFARFDVLT